MIFKLQRWNAITKSRVLGDRVWDFTTKNRTNPQVYVVDFHENYGVYVGREISILI
jgi:hypothetical protein